MGMLSDFFISHDEDASAYDCGDGVPEADRCQYKGIGVLQVGQMLAVLRGKPDSFAECTNELSLAYEESEDGPWTMKVPDDFVTIMAQKSPDDALAIAARWSLVTSEELDWSTEDFLPVVSDLIRLAKSASSTGKSLYLWNCL